MKAKPKTDIEKCENIGKCVKVCPMDSIDPNDVTKVPGICIKCHACIYACPNHAKYFDDKEFLSHVKMLEKNYLKLNKNKIYS